MSEIIAILTELQLALLDFAPSFSRQVSWIVGFQVFKGLDRDS